MSKAGWYPDPGGAPGMFRYWDGSTWSQSVSPQPGVTDPQDASVWAPDAPLPHPRGTQPLLTTGAPSANYAGGQPLTTRTPAPTPPVSAQRSRGVKGLGWWVLVFLIVAAVFFAASQLLRAAGIDPVRPAPANPTINPCPPEPVGVETPVPHPNDGRVHGGKLSYPELGAPWDAPSGDNRLPFGRDVSVQQVMVEENYRVSNGREESWVASILVGEMLAGDGFFSPKEGAELITQCAIKSFYSDAVVTRNDKVSKAVTIDGYRGWEIETHLSFDIPGLQVKGETAIFVVVQIDNISSSVYYASIPDSVPELLNTARTVQTQLRVDD